MKTEIKKFAIPFATVAFALASAFAGNTTAKSGTALADPNGYRLVSGVCTETSKVCSRTFNPIMCKDIANNQLYDWNGTSCPDPLYHKP